MFLRERGERFSELVLDKPHRGLRVLKLCASSACIV